MGRVLLPRTDADYDQLREVALRKEIVKKSARSFTFGSGSSQTEVDVGINEGEWEIVGFEIDGANFGDGLNSYAEVFIDRQGMGSGIIAPFGIRVGAGYFGGFTPFHLEPSNVVRIRSGESIYIAMENGTDADVSAMVEWSLRRVAK